MTLNLQIFFLSSCLFWRMCDVLSHTSHVHTEQRNVCVYILYKRWIVNSESRYLYIILYLQLLIFLYIYLALLYVHKTCVCVCFFLLSPDKLRKFYARENAQTCTYLDGTITAEKYNTQNIHRRRQRSIYEDYTVEVLRARILASFIRVYLLISQILSVCCQNKHAKDCVKECFQSVFCCCSEILLGVGLTSFRGILSMANEVPLNTLLSIWIFDFFLVIVIIFIMFGVTSTFLMLNPDTRMDAILRSRK